MLFRNWLLPTLSLRFKLNILLAFHFENFYLKHPVYIFSMQVFLVCWICHCSYAQLRVVLFSIRVHVIWKKPSKFSFLMCLMTLHFCLKMSNDCISPSKRRPFAIVFSIQERETMIFLLAAASIINLLKSFFKGCFIISLIALLAVKCSHYWQWFCINKIEHLKVWWIIANFQIDAVGSCNVNQKSRKTDLKINLHRHISHQNINVLR